VNTWVINGFGPLFYFASPLVFEDDLFTAVFVFYAVGSPYNLSSLSIAINVAHEVIAHYIPIFVSGANLKASPAFSSYNTLHVESKLPGLVPN
jgi:hypothetical protein